MVLLSANNILPVIDSSTVQRKGVDFWLDRRAESEWSQDQSKLLLFLKAPTIIIKGFPHLICVLFIIFSQNPTTVV